MLLCNIFQVHSALALTLLALAAGVVLMGKSCSGDSCCNKFSKVAGGFIVVVSLLSAICILYLSTRSCPFSSCKFGSNCERGNIGWQHPPIPADLSPADAPTK